VRRRPGCRCGGVWFAPGNAGSGNCEDVYCATVSGPLVSGSTGGSECESNPNANPAAQPARGHAERPDLDNQTRERTRPPGRTYQAGRRALCQALPGQREIRARPHRGRWAPASSGGGRPVRPHGRAVGWPRPVRTSSSRARVSLTRSLCSPGWSPARREADDVGRCGAAGAAAVSRIGREVERISPDGRVVPPVPQLPVPQLRSAPAVPVLPRRGTGRSPGSRSMRLGEAVCQS
jgi:hypothetical protein